ncbi:MAG TPA: VWA domain-containing protein [Pyrinomonadaceae bacterium]|nr:VWA domain-containing protein [Pyrinomonadaceae bacterium]
MFYRVPSARSLARASRRSASPLALLPLTLILLCAPARAQLYEHELDAPGSGVAVRVRNRTGRVSVVAEDGRARVALRATTTGLPVGEKEVRVRQEAGVLSVEVGREGAQAPDGRKSSATPAQIERERIDLVVRVPARSRVRVETEAGAVDLSGNVAEAEVSTDTGTIRADVPLDALRYHFRWTLSRPRFFSEVALPEVRRKRGGAYEIAGRFGSKEAKKDERIELDLETARGVLLFGVTDESNVPSDLRERALTEAARAIIRSGDADLTDAIRKVAPRLVGDYAATLPPRQSEPQFSARRNPLDVRTPAGHSLARLHARVTDRSGRAIHGLTARDFAVTEDGVERAVREVTPSTAPFNLVLLLDVSGSVEERLDFIRKAALDFVNTAGPRDQIAVLSFRDDVQLISEFTTDRRLLAKRIKDIQAGGATALYDALAYSLVHTLKPLRGERTGVVILSDGDDNRSFLTLPSILEAVVESGAVVFPLYVPSGLISADSASATRPATTLDPVRTRFLTLTSRADEEGRRLAEISGGTYYPVTRLEQLQQAYDDVVTQLRTSYSITYESAPEAKAGSRVRVRVAREGASVRLSPAVGVAATTSAPAAP